MIPPVPGAAQSRGGRPLDPERPTPDDLPLGLRAQIGATRDALRGLAQAHLDLAKAEASEIGGEVARAAGLGVVAFVCALMLFFLVFIGLCLFLGAWLFGSMGWGVLMGALLLVAVAVFAVLTALRVPGLLTMLGLAALLGIVVAALLFIAAPNLVWTWIGEVLNLPVESASRPLAVAAVLWGTVGAIAGALSGYRSSHTTRGTVGGLFAGLLVGVIVGALLAITFEAQVSIAIGVCTALIAWPVLMGVQVSRAGIDEEALKRRFTPQVTIDTTKETIEWAKARMPLGPQS